MKSKYFLLISTVVFASTLSHAKEYLGIDMGNTTLDKIKQKLDQEGVPYTLKYEKDSKGNEIQSIASLYFNDYQAWQKYGKIKEATVQFIGGKVYAMRVSWDDDKNGSLFENLCSTFTKKYGIIREPATDGRDWDVVTYGYYSDSHTHIKLEKKQVWPTRLKPLNWHYITSVDYEDVDFDQLKEKQIKNANSQHEQKYQFANDF